MNPQLQAWRQAGKHLPDFLKDFHDQKDVFIAMHEMFGEPNKDATIKRPSVVEGQCYVVDCFLWFMARHGYTLQRSRAGLEFDCLADNVKAIKGHRAELFAQALSAPVGPSAADADSTRQPERPA